MNKTQDFDKLIGKKFKLYYNSNLNTFQLDNTIYEVVEDPCDDYRSCLKDVLIISDTALERYFLADVEVLNGFNSRYSNEGYTLIDDSGHIWLEFGTDNYDDYYPCFIYNWNPKERVVKLSKILEDNLDDL